MTFEDSIILTLSINIPQIYKTYIIQGYNVTSLKGQKHNTKTSLLRTNLEVSKVLHTSKRVKLLCKAYTYRDCMSGPLNRFLVGFIL